MYLLLNYYEPLTKYFDLTTVLFCYMPISEGLVKGCEIHTAEKLAMYENS